MQKTALVAMLALGLSMAGCVDEEAPAPLVDPFDREIGWELSDPESNLPFPRVGDNVTISVQPEPTVNVTYTIHMGDEVLTIERTSNQTSPTSVPFTVGGRILVEASWLGGNTSGFVPVADDLTIEGTVPGLGDVTELPLNVTEGTTALRVWVSDPNPLIFRVDWRLLDPEGQQLGESEIRGLFHPKGETFPAGTYIIEVTNHEAWPNESVVEATVDRFYHEGGQITPPTPQR